MGTGAPASPEIYIDHDINGFGVEFDVFFTTPGPPYPLQQIIAKRQQGCAWTQIQVIKRNGTVDTFPLPNSGAKDGNGYFTATITKGQINAAGYVDRYDIQSWTVF